MLLTELQKIPYLQVHFRLSIVTHCKLHCFTENLTSLMLCWVTVRSMCCVVRQAVAFKIASLSGALLSCFFYENKHKQQR